MRPYLRYQQFTQEPKVRPLAWGVANCSFINSVRTHYHYISFVVNWRVYEIPEKLGREELCNICKNQLECLSGTTEKTLEI